MYTTIDGIISTPYMIQVRGNSIERNKKRWGFHVFEGYASTRSYLAEIKPSFMDHCN